MARHFYAINNLQKQWCTTFCSVLFWSIHIKLMQKMLVGLLVSILTVLPLLFRLKFRAGGSNQERQHQGID